MPRLRSLWLRLHRWLALTVGWVLVLAGLTGAVLVVAQPLDRWAHPELFRAAAPPAIMAARDSALPLAPLLERLQSEFGRKSSITFKPPGAAGDTLWVLVRGNWSGTLFLNPWTGEEQGRRGEAEGAINLLFKWHSALLLGSAGKAVLAWVSLAYLVLLISGLILWWPRRWPANWHIEWGKGLLRALFDLHRVGGVVLGLLMAVSVATGAYLAWRPLAVAISVVAGATPVKPPRLGASDTRSMPAPTVDQLLATARAAIPDSPVGFVQIPGQAGQPVRIRFRMAEDPHPNGISSVWLNPHTGQVLAVHRLADLDPGARAQSFIYPLHTGGLGGVVLELVVGLAGLALAVLGCSGLWLWLGRHLARRSARQ